MIREVAELKIDPSREAEFLKAVEEAVPIFKAAKGCKSMRLEKVVEDGSVFRLHVLWQTLEDHTETFRNSEGFQSWRALAGPFFVEPPKVDHSAIAVEGFGD